MKKLLILVLSAVLCLSFYGCSSKNETPAPQTAEQTDSPAVSDEASEEKTEELISKAEAVIASAGYSEYDLENADVSSEEDTVNNRLLYAVSVKCGDKTAVVHFDENGSLVRYSSGSVTSEGDGVYTADKTDDVLKIAKDYYDALDVPAGYEISGWQMDFGGCDWQVEFSKKIDVAGYDKAVYNYGEMVRMRISGADGSLLSVNVFNTSLKTYDTDSEMISYETALSASGLSEELLSEKYIGCYTLKDKGYARLCWCFEADCAEKDEVCHTEWKYVDLYTGELIGEETCH